MKLLELTHVLNFCEIEKAIIELKQYWEEQGFDTLVSIHETKFKMTWRIEIWGWKL